MENFSELTSETISMSIQLLSEAYLALRKKSYSLTFSGLTLTIDERFSIFLTMNRNIFADLPREIRDIYRCCHTVAPDTEMIVSQLLRICGFSKDGELVQLIERFGEFCKSQLPSRKLGMPTYELKEIIKEASEYLSSATNEREAFLVALSNFVMPQLPEKEKPICQGLIVNIFGPSVQPPDPEEPKRLIAEYFKLRDLTLTPAIERNIMDCFEVACRWSAIHVVDSDAAGSDLAIECVKHLLAKTIQSNVVVRTIFPRVYSIGELFGEFVPRASGQGTYFRSGVLQQVTKELISQYPSAMDENLGRMNTVYNEKNIERWIVFDGTASNDWIEGLITAINTTNRFISLPNFEKLSLPSNLKLLFRCESLAYVSPSIAVRLGRMQPGADYNWHQHLGHLFNNLESELPVLAERQLVPKVKNWTIKFFDNLFDGKGLASLMWVVRLTDLEIANNFFIVFKSLLADFLVSSFDRDEHMGRLDAIVSSMMFVAVGISVGSLISPAHAGRFEQLVEDKLAHNMSISGKNVLQRGLSPKTFQADDCSKLYEPLIDDLNTLDDLKPISKLRLLSPQQLWYANALAKVTLAKNNLLLMNDGRPSIRRLYSHTLAKITEENNNIQTAYTKWTVDLGSHDLLMQVKKTLVPRNKLLYVPKISGGVVYLAEDINMPPRNNIGEIGALEMLRCLLREGQVFDTALGEYVQFEGLQTMLSSDMSITTSDFLTRRYRRKYTVVGLQGNQDTELKMTIFSACMRLTPAMLPDFYEKEMLTSLSSKIADIFVFSKAEFLRLSGQEVTRDMMHLDKLTDIFCNACSAKLSFEQEENLLSFVLNELALYIKSICPQATENQLRNAVSNSTSKVYRMFDPQTVHINPYETFVVAQAAGSFRFSVGEGKADTFKAQVVDIMQQSKEFQDFAMLDDQLVALHNFVKLLAPPGSRIVIKTPNDPRLLVGMAARLLNFELVEIDLSQTEQLAAVSHQIGKLLEDALAHRKWRVIFVRMESIRDLKVMRLLQDVILLGDTSQLDINISSVRDAIFSAGLETNDESDFVQSVWNYRCRFVFIRESTNNSDVQVQMDSYSLIKTSLGPMTIPEWQASSLVNIAAQSMDKFEELDMLPEQKNLTAKCLAEIYLFSKTELAKYNIEIGQASFGHSCQYTCEIKSRTKTEIKDQLRNYQTAISRFRALTRLKDELNLLEGQAIERLKAAEKDLEETIKSLGAASVEFRKQKE